MSSARDEHFYEMTTDEWTYSHLDYSANTRVEQDYSTETRVVQDAHSDYSTDPRAMQYSADPRIMSF